MNSDAPGPAPGRTGLATGGVEFDAVLLAGGRASRVGGDDKTAFTAGGATLLDRAVEAAAGARAVVVVGLRDGRDAPLGVALACEEPRWAGPVAALAAGLGAVADPSPWTLVLACDLPRAPEAVRALLEGGPRTWGEDDGTVAVDGTGRRQPLLAFYRTDALARRLDDLWGEGPLTDLSLRRVLAGLTLAEASVADELCADVDSPADLARLGVERPTTRSAG